MANRLPGDPHIMRICGWCHELSTEVVYNVLRTAKPKAGRMSICKKCLEKDRKNYDVITVTRF